jgi:replicative DNA helicase
MKWLADKYVPELVSRINTEKPVESSPDEQSHIGRGSLYELVYKYGKRLLYESAGENALKYLVNIRGYDRELLAKTEWIYFPPERDIRQYLLSQCPEANDKLKSEINDLSLTGGFGDDFSRLAVPYRDRYGVILGFAKRATEARSDGQRYDATAGMKKTDLFGLHRCRGKKDVIIAEGYPDAAYLPALGLDNVVATGQGSFSKKYLDGLKSCGIKTATLAFDNDPETESGLTNTERAVDILIDAGIRVYVLDPRELGDVKDPDEYVRKHGVGKFRDLIKNARAGQVWKLEQILGVYHSENDRDEREALEKSVEYINAVTDTLDRKNCRQVLKKHFPDMTDSEIDEHLADHWERKRKEKTDSLYLDMAKKMTDGVSKGDTDGLQDYVNTIIAEINGVAGERPLEPHTHDDLVNKLLKVPEGVQTGYQCLDKYLTIRPGGITVIAGRPSHGKTTFMENILVNMLRKYRDRSFVFFSYEAPWQNIILSLYAMLSGEIIDENNNINQIARYVKFRNDDREKLNRAIDLYKTYTAEGRLYIIDNPYPVTRLVNVITTLKREHQIGAVFIDYIQKIGYDGKSAPTRQVELQRISSTLLDASINLSIPVIVGAQVNRDAAEDKNSFSEDKLREAGDIEQDADIIIGIWNEAKSKEPQTSDVVDFHVMVRKNRQGRPSFDGKLLFNLPTLTIRGEVH